MHTIINAINVIIIAPKPTLDNTLFALLVMF